MSSNLEKLKQNEPLRQLGLLAIIMVPIYFFWYGPILYPLRILTVFFHEASHAIATVFTGGRIAEFAVEPNISGHVKRYGGNSFLVSNAGYLGSCLWGSVIYLIAARSDWDRWIIATLGATLIVISIYFSAEKFALMFGIGCGATMLLLGKFAPNYVCDILLRIVGMTTMFSALFAVYTGIFLGRSVGISDAHNLANQYGGTPKIWAVIWMVIMGIIIALTLKRSIIGKRKKTGK